MHLHLLRVNFIQLEIGERERKNQTRTCRGTKEIYQQLGQRHSASMFTRNRTQEIRQYAEMAATTSSAGTQWAQETNIATQGATKKAPNRNKNQRNALNSQPKNPTLKKLILPAEGGQGVAEIFEAAGVEPIRY